MPEDKKLANRWMVYIFAGRDSLHQKWKENHKEFGFDLCLLQWDTEHVFTDKNSKNAAYTVKRKGLRFGLLSQFMKDNPGVLEAYDYHFVMDDDIETNPSEIKKLLSICRDFQFDLAQPALDVGSHVNYPNTRKHDGFKFRTTNCVEIMMPVFSQRAFKLFQEDLHLIPSGIGWGLEMVWEILFHAGEGMSIWGGRIGVIDDVNFKHVRECGYGKATGVYANGGTGYAWADLMYFRHERYKEKWREIAIHHFHGEPIDRKEG